MSGRMLCSIECATVVAIIGSLGLAQDQRLLPDAPSAVLVRERMSDSTFPSGFSGDIVRQQRTRKFLSSTQVGALSFQPEPLVHNDAERLSAIGHKLMPVLPMPAHEHYAPSESSDTLNRAKNAIGHVLFGHDEQGHAKANGAYLLGAMVTSFLSTAHQPYVHHPPTEVLGNFGSTVGGAAGTNLFNEFWPQLKKGFVSRIPRALQKPAGVFKNP